MRFRFSAIVTAAVVCLIPTMGFGDLGPYSQDFEGLDKDDPAALGNDGWLVFGNVFDDQWRYRYGYGVFPAPNGTGGFSSIITGVGGPDQGEQSLNVFSDYLNGDHARGWYIESLVFQEQQIGAADAGSSWVFDYEAIRGNIEGRTTAKAFIKTLDPSAGFATTNFITIDMTNVNPTWGSYSIPIFIDEGLEGQLLQFGFLSVATLYQGSGIYYDNVSFSQAKDQCHQNTVSAGSGLGVVEVCSRAEADDLAGDEEASICVDLNHAEASCAGGCPGGNCDCIVEGFWNPRNNYNFRRTCTAAPVQSCPGGEGFVCDFSTVSYTCPCVCRVPGDPGGTSGLACTDESEVPSIPGQKTMQLN